MKMSGEGFFIGYSDIPQRNSRIIHIYSGEVNNVDVMALWDQDCKADVASGIKQNTPVKFEIEQRGNFKQLLSVYPQKAGQ